MPTPTCLKCRREIPGDDINVAQDVAYCRDCNISYRLSELTYGGISESVDLHHPPKGAWYVSDGSGTVIGATSRNILEALGLLFFAFFWNSLVSVFVVFVLAGTLHLLHVPLPVWFPAPKMNGGNTSVGMIIFLWIFLTPFITVGVFVAGSCLSSLFGRTEVRIENANGIVFIGIGKLGWKRRFDATQVKATRILKTYGRTETVCIVIETREGKQIKFGSMLTNERLQFVFGALRKTILR